MPLFRLKIYAVLEEKTANHLLSRYEMHLRNSARDETNHDISLSKIIKYVASVWLNSKKIHSFIVSIFLVVRFIDVRDNTIG